MRLSEDDVKLFYKLNPALLLFVNLRLGLRKEMFPHLPIMVDTVLMPFKHHVIYDGFIAPYSMTFGGGILCNFKTGNDKAKENLGL